MREWLVAASEVAIVVIDAMALIAIVYGTLEAFVKALRAAFGSVTQEEGREIWLRYSRWLVVGLTFQLAADIIESSVATSWESIGRLAAIAVIRTFLNYFLERDLAEARERKQRAAG